MCLPPPIVIMLGKRKNIIFYVVVKLPANPAGAVEVAMC